jgi:hypothetical protein
MPNHNALLALANTGANLSLDCSKYSASTLQAVANICKTMGTHLTVRNASKLAPTALQALANTLQGHLTVED